MNEFELQIRGSFLDQGATLVKQELDAQASDAVRLKDQVELRNVDLLSINLIANRNIHQTVKALVTERSLNVRKIIAATAYFIEESNFQRIDEAVSNLQGGRFDQRRLNALVASQKKISLSYGSLAAVVEIFKRANESIKTDIQAMGTATDAAKRIQKTNLYLKNAILIYELTHFVVEYISDFGLDGEGDLRAIQKEVIADVSRLRESDKKLKNDLKSVSEKLRPAMQREIEQREKFHDRVVQKWDQMLERVEGQKGKTKEARNILNDLKAIRDNAKNRIDALNLAATTTLVDNSIEVIESMASGLGDFELPELNEQTACELLGVSME